MQKARFCCALLDFLKLFMYLDYVLLFMYCLSCNYSSVCRLIVQKPFFACDHKLTATQFFFFRSLFVFDKMTAEIFNGFWKFAFLNFLFIHLYATKDVLGAFLTTTRLLSQLDFLLYLDPENKLIDFCLKIWVEGASFWCAHVLVCFFKGNQ